MGSWSGKHKCCVNCGTTARSHAGRGLCSRCHLLTRKIEATRNWDPSDLTTLKHCPVDIPLLSRDTIVRLRSGLVDEYQGQMETLRVRGAKATGAIQGIDLELILDRIATYAGVGRKCSFNGLATVIDSELTPQQREFVYQLLHRIEDVQPVPKPNLTRAFGNDVSG